MLEYNAILSKNGLTGDSLDQQNNEIAKAFEEGARSNSIKKSRTVFIKRKADGDYVSPAVIDILKKERDFVFIDACKFYKQHSASVEILRDKKLERVNFFLPVYSEFLNSNVKVDFQVQVDRTSSKSKVQYFQKKAIYLINRAKQEYSIFLKVKKIKGLNLMFLYPDVWQNLGFYTAVITCFLMLFSYSIDIRTGYIKNPCIFGHFFEFECSTIYIGVSVVFYKIAGIVIAFCSLIKTVSDIARIAPLYYNRDLNKIPQSFLVKTKNFIKENVIICYYIFYTVMAFFGIIVHPFFYSVLLTEIVIKFKMLQSVINAVWQPRRQLVYTFMLFWIVIYLFAIWAYEYKYYYFESNHLTHLYHYLFRVYDITFKYDSGIGGYFEETKIIPYNGVIFDALFNLIVVMVMLDVVSGIIIDTFGALRLNYEERIMDMNNRCFICGINKEEFDRLSDVNNRYSPHIKVISQSFFLKIKGPSQYLELPLVHRLPY